MVTLVRTAKILAINFEKSYCQHGDVLIFARIPRTESIRDDSSRDGRNLGGIFEIFSISSIVPQFAPTRFEPISQWCNGMQEARRQRVMTS